MNALDFEHLLKRTIGLDARSIGSSAVEMAVKRRMAARGSADLAGYWEQVQGSEIELQELVEAVVVPETWFFRDPHVFKALGELAKEAWPALPPGRELRLLSIPCSSGEEPYSMAMTLLSAGVPPERFHIDGVDVSQQILERARNGIYGQNSFRGTSAVLCDPYCEPIGSRRRVIDPVRARVSFRSDNLLGETFLAGEANYDFIFCRNLLIYFDRPTQGVAIRRLERLLNPEGYLFVTAAEASLPLSQGFTSVKIPLAFAYRKTQAGALPSTRPAAPAIPSPVPRAAAPVVASRTVPRPPPAPLAPLAPISSRPPAPATSESDLDRAARLADLGRLAEAAELCEAYLRKHKTSARALYLLGLTRDAAGDLPAAREAYRQAVYLEPNHQEALAHLALVTAKLGDADGARRLDERARRLQEKLKRTASAAGPGEAA